jgi:predicted TIM-barrel fold metal-dependent hydrolase
MIDDYLVVDGVVHGYNWTKENWAIPEAAITSAAGAGFHKFLTKDDDSRLTEEEFLRNWGADDLEEILFLEAGVDIVAYHGTPIWDFYKDGHSDTEKGFILRERNPSRVIVYGAVNPFDGAAALDRVRYLVNERGVDGLKVYAASYHDGMTRSQPLDDPDHAYPFIELALDLGVKVIATHKAMPFGPVRAEPYGVGDLAAPCALYPEMNFEVVHSGFAFVEDTTFLCSFPNVWLNLEASFGLLLNAPDRFAQFFGEFLNAGAARKMFFATGCALAHPLPVIEAFLDFQMPPHLAEGYGYPLITDEIRRDVLGLNLLRLHQIDPAKRLADLAGDQWSVRRANEGGGAPYSHFRAARARAKG